MEDELLDYLQQRSDELLEGLNTSSNTHLLKVLGALEEIKKFIEFIDGIDEY